MARSRNIKPGFFTNELLVELPFDQRLLFIGLWTIADREGRLEDRPKKIKMSLFAADNCDVEAGLAALTERGFILRYEVGGSRYIQVLAWHKHQQPHHKEKASVIPAPGKPEALTSTSADKSPGQAPDKAESGPVPAALIPDSLIPDSLQQTCPAKPDRDDFGTWYKAYPRHEAQDDARRAWDKRVKAKELPPLPELLETIAWQKRVGCLRPEFADGRSLIPLPATYLNKGKFKDARPRQDGPKAAPCRYCPAPATDGGYCAKHAEDERAYLASTQRSAA
jgi:hypothetical protein